MEIGWWIWTKLSAGATGYNTKETAMTDYNLRLLRIQSRSNHTLGAIYTEDLKKDFVCFTVEDEYRAVKVVGETRIPAGKYEIKFYAAGTKFHPKYLEKYGAAWHKGMLMLQNVPGFSTILIHCGNTEKDTEGCLIVGDSVDSKLGTIDAGTTRPAYERLYPLVRDALLAGRKAWITVEDYA